MSGFSTNSGLWDGASGLWDGASGLWGGSSGFQPGAGRTWGGWTVTTGFVQSPANTFTRNTADSWVPTVTSVSAFTGPTKMEGSLSSIGARDTAWGLDANRAVTAPYACEYCWYITATSATTRLSSAVRVTGAAPLAGDIYGVRKTGSAGSWLIEWYRIRSGTLTVIDSTTTATDESLGVLAGSFQNGTAFSLSTVSK